MAEALERLAQSIDEDGHHHAALPLVQESIALFKRAALPTDPDWAESVGRAFSFLANIMRSSGRLEEAVAALEEAIEVRRVGGLREMDTSIHSMLTLAYVETGRYEKALERGKEMEAFIEAVRTGTVQAQGDYLYLVKWALRPSLYVALASAYEGLGRMKACTKYHKRALSIIEQVKIASGDFMSCFDREARLLCEQGQVVKAEECLQRPLKDYLVHLETSGGLTVATSSFMHMFPPLRRLGDIKRGLGKEAEAWAMALDLDETEAMLVSRSAAALNELQEEMQAEEATRGTGGQQQQQQGNSNKKKGKLTRKQQKRKAAQRRRARRSRR